MFHKGRSEKNLTGEVILIWPIKVKAEASRQFRISGGQGCSEPADPARGENFGVLIDKKINFDAFFGPNQGKKATNFTMKKYDRTGEV